MDKKAVKTAAAKIKSKNIPFVFNTEAVYGLIKRICGDKGELYAEKIVLRQIEPVSEGLDRYIVSDTDNGKVLIECTDSISACCAFKWYLENRCNSYVGPLTRRMDLPDCPPSVKCRTEKKSVCLYRYFLNYCTFGYTLGFWNFDEWEKLIDWMMLSGYNLVLNPIANECVWFTVLNRLGYKEKEARDFISSPVTFPWQCMINISGVHGSAGKAWYERALGLSKNLNERLMSFGAAVMLPGWCGMIPNDFKAHFPDSSPYDQGNWCYMKRPSLLLQDDKYFEKVGRLYYESQKELLGGGFRYFSTDPFHEGGDSSRVNLNEYTRMCYSLMKDVEDGAVWFLQGWQDKPLRTMLKALTPSEVLIGNLRATHNLDGGDNFADYPWLYCCVNNFGGQRAIRGNMNKLMHECMETVNSEKHTCVGIGMIPEGIECCEILYDVISDYAVYDKAYDRDAWLKRKLEIRYGKCPQNTFEAWKIIRDELMVTDEVTPKESALCTRPSLTVDRVCFYSYPDFVYDIKRVRDAFELLMKDYKDMTVSETYRLDMVDIARQVVADGSWKYLNGIQSSFVQHNQTEFENNVSAFMHAYDVQSKLLCCDSHTMLGTWLKRAEDCGKTKAEKAYYKYLAITIINLWGDRSGASELADYAYREYSGLLEDFYKKRWEVFINILRISFITGNEPMEYSNYDAEFFMSLTEKDYPCVPYANLDEALTEVLKFGSNLD